MPTRDLEHIGSVLPRVMEEIASEQQALELEHAKPRALQAVQKAREASYQVRSPHQTQAPQRRRQNAGAFANERVACPVCDGAACKEKPSRLACCHCGWVSVLEQGEWRSVERCRLWNGEWPAEQEGST